MAKKKDEFPMLPILPMFPFPPMFSFSFEAGQFAEGDEDKAEGIEIPDLIPHVKDFMTSLIEFHSSIDEYIQEQFDSFLEDTFESDEEFILSFITDEDGKKFVEKLYETIKSQHELASKQASADKKARRERQEKICSMLPDKQAEEGTEAHKEEAKADDAKAEAKAEKAKPKADKKSEAAELKAKRSAAAKKAAVTRKANAAKKEAEAPKEQKAEESKEDDKQ